MTDLTIRAYTPSDEQQVIDRWQECDLVVPWNDPRTDIQRKMDDSPELFFVVDGRIAASYMAGYDGHRGWMYYLAVRPDSRKLDRPLRALRKDNLIIGDPKTIFLLTKQGEKKVAEILKALKQGKLL
ncbi:MAG: acetyltransferase GCN5 [Proteobacteria bacterium]|nr:acetyltransferase GCN5 [Pseudomonadota bacterium]